MQALGSTLASVHRWVKERLPVSLTTDTHSFEPGGAVWVKEWNVQPLAPLCEGPVYCHFVHPLLQSKQLTWLPGFTTAEGSRHPGTGSAFLIRPRCGSWPYGRSELPRRRLQRETAALL